MVRVKLIFMMIKKLLSHFHVLDCFATLYFPCLIINHNHNNYYNTKRTIWHTHDLRGKATKCTHWRLLNGHKINLCFLASTNWTIRVQYSGHMIFSTKQRSYMYVQQQHVNISATNHDNSVTCATFLFIVTLNIVCKRSHGIFSGLANTHL